jgi:phosphatidylglycerophosphatase A
VSSDAGPPRLPRAPSAHARSRTAGLTLFVAQGFGVGARLPAPGTWGSLLGVGLFAALAWPGHYPFYLAGTVICVWLSVPLCTAAESALGQKDPGSVVLDELTAMPLCYLGWVTATWLEVGRCSLPDLFANTNGWLLIGAGFLAFRFFDILKPWPIRSVQRLPGGWGVVLDDVLAALATALVLFLCSRLPTAP